MRYFGAAKAATGIGEERLAGNRTLGAVLDELRAATANGDKVLRWFDADVLDEQGDVVARTRKQLYVRRKPGR